MMPIGSLDFISIFVDRRRGRVGGMMPIGALDFISQSSLIVEEGGRDDANRSP